MDITTVILEDHEEQRRTFALLDEVGNDEGRVGAVWERLVVLLEVHAEAEEKLFYPRLLEVGRGADGDSPSEETEDAVHDHNEIRDAIAKVGDHRVGTPDWWSAVAEAREANSDHMAEEERGPLADFRRHASLQDRHDIAVAFRVFEAEHSGGVRPRDLDPEQFVDENSPTGG